MDCYCDTLLFMKNFTQFENFIFKINNEYSKIILNRFRIRFNQPLFENNFLNKFNNYFINDNMIQGIEFEHDSINLQTKHQCGSNIYNLSFLSNNNNNNLINNNINNNENKLILLNENLELNIKKDFENLLKNYNNLCSSEQIIKNFTQIKTNLNEEIKCLIDPPLPEDTLKNKSIESNSFILKNKHSSSLYYSLYKNINNLNLISNNSFLELAATNLFNINIRDSIKIGVLYVKNGQKEQNSILKNDWNSVSEECKSFFSSLGELIDLSNHKWFNGKLDTTNFTNGRYQIFYSNERFEVMFHVAPLLPTDLKDDQQIYKKRHIGNDNIHLIWSEHQFDYDPQTITSQFNDAHIIIYPLKFIKDFYRVVINKKNDIKFGPLFNEILLNKNELSTLVRWTAIISDRIVRLNTSEYNLPSIMFKNSLNSFKEKIK